MSFLHTDGYLFSALPELAERMQRLVRETDAANWRLLDRPPAVDLSGSAAASDGGMGLRCCEYHRMKEGGHLGDIHHHDEVHACFNVAPLVSLSLGASLIF